MQVGCSISLRAIDSDSSDEVFVTRYAAWYCKGGRVEEEKEKRIVVEERGEEKERKGGE